ncbi:MAG: hypothetical protein PVG65_07060 [Candidatus Thorarchaeota archaeon]|jgi:hypothetical protein
MNKKLFSIFGIVILSLGVVSAYNGWGYGYFSPEQLFQNEWVIFALVFMIFFAFIFFALSKPLKENRGAAMVISIALALFIAVAISQRVRFYGYFGSELGSWMFVIAILICIAFVMKVLTSLIGGLGLLISLYGIWAIAGRADIYDIFPYGVLTSGFESFYYFLSSGTFLVILMLLTILAILLAIKDKPEGFRKWFFAKKDVTKELKIPLK